MRLHYYLMLLLTATASGSESDTSGSQLAWDVYNTVSCNWNSAKRAGVRFGFVEVRHFLPEDGAAEVTHTTTGTLTTSETAVYEDYTTVYSNRDVSRHVVQTYDGQVTRGLATGERTSSQGQATVSRHGAIRSDHVRRSPMLISAESMETFLHPDAWIDEYTSISRPAIEKRRQDGRIPALVRHNESVDANGDTVLTSTFVDPDIIGPNGPECNARELIFHPGDDLPFEARLTIDGRQHLACQLSWSQVASGTDPTPIVLTSATIKFPGVNIPGVISRCDYSVNSITAIDASCDLGVEFPPGTTVIDLPAGTRYIIGDAASTQNTLQSVATAFSNAPSSQAELPDAEETSSKAGFWKTGVASVAGALMVGASLVFAARHKRRPS